jgi:hypothetical protein
MAGWALPKFVGTPPTPMLIRSVVAIVRSRTKISVAPFVSPGTRLLAEL